MSDDKLEQHILCVDDDLDFLKSLEVFLPERINAAAPPNIWYRFLFIGSPIEALETLRELQEQGETVAMLISDQKMPEMKGIEFLNESRQVSEASVRVLLTGNAGMESAIVAINSKLLDKYLTKPIDNQHDFTVSIQHLLQRFHMRQVIEQQSRIIHDLYNFSNLLNAATSFDALRREIRTFAEQTLHCREIFVLLPDVFPAGGIPLDGSTDRWRELSEARLDAAGVVELRRLCAAGAGDAAVRLLHDATWGAGSTAISSAASFFCAALTAENRLLGLVVMRAEESNAEEQAAVRHALSCIATTASIAVTNRVNQTRLEQAYEETRRQAERLEEMNARLQVLDSAKSSFFSFVSHELRTALTCMSALDLMDQCASPEQSGLMLEMVRSGYGRLNGLVVGCLGYMDVFDRPADAGQQSNLSLIARSVISEIFGEEDGGNPDLILDIEDDCLAEADPAMLREVVQTLIANARKFSDGQPQIMIGLTTEADAVRLTVTDHGRGFKPEWAAEIFQPFGVADDIHHSRGTALNLAKAHTQISLAGGRMQASSDGPGQGATFIVELPLRLDGRSSDDGPLALAA